MGRRVTGGGGTWRPPTISDLVLFEVQDMPERTFYNVAPQLYTTLTRSLWVRVDVVASPETCTRGIGVALLSSIGTAIIVALVRGERGITHPLTRVAPCFGRIV